MKPEHATEPELDLFYEELDRRIFESWEQDHAAGICGGIEAGCVFCQDSRRSELSMKGKSYVEI